MRLQKKAEILSQIDFFGSLPKDFEPSGREQFCYLIKAGLYPDSKVVDIGCGVLRTGYWLINFLNQGCYCGIEPHTERLAMGLDTIVGPELRETKRPRFDSNEIFNTGVFAQKFDFFLAYSIWTHASKHQICLMLDSFVRDAELGAKFLTTYLPAVDAETDYMGMDWVGTSHKSTQIGCIHHSFEWIQKECQLRNIALKKLDDDMTYGQSWLELQLS